METSVTAPTPKAVVLTWAWHISYHVGDCANDRACVHIRDCNHDREHTPVWDCQSCCIIVLASPKVDEQARQHRKTTTMDIISFRNALTRCGVAQPQARQAIIAQGYSNMDLFATRLSSDTGVEKFVKTINKLPAGADDVRPNVPYASIRMLQAMRHWTIERKRLGQAIVHNQMTADELTRILERIEEEEQVTTMKPTPPPLPDKFVSFGPKWRAFAEGFKGHCAVVRGCMGIPLLYVLRDHVDVTPEMAEFEYDSSDKRLMNLVILEGKDYKMDNIRVWELLRPLVHETPAWNYIKRYNETQNGRMAFLVLQTRGEGDAAVDARRTAAEEAIQKAKYDGKSKRFTLQSYINLLQGAFAELETCGPEYAYSEKQKVSVFTKGIVSEEYAATKHSIYQNPETRNDFQKCYAFVETMEQFKPSYSGSAHFDRNISEVKAVDSTYRSPAQWQALSKEERMAIISSRKAKGSDNKSKQKKKKKDKREDRKRRLEEVVKAATDDLSALTSGTDPTMDSAGGNNNAVARPRVESPGDQFGRHAHAIKKILSKVAAAAMGKKPEAE